MEKTKQLFIAISQNNVLGSFTTSIKASNYLVSIGFTKRDPKNSNKFLFYASSDIFAEIQETKLNIAFKKQTFKY